MDNQTQPQPATPEHGATPEVGPLPVAAPEVAPKASASAPATPPPAAPASVAPSTAPPVAATAAAADALADAAMKPVIADDVDVIEKEWVDAAENIVAATSQDPRKEEDQIEDLQIDYLKKRYGKEVGKS